MNARTITLISLAVLFAGFWFLRSGKGLLMPEKQEAPLMCARPECGVAFTALLPIPYEKWPVKCPKCGEKSGFPRSACRKCGASYALDVQAPLEKCPKCGADLPH